MATLPSVKLNDGKSMPVLGYGTGTSWFKNSGSKLDQSLIDSVKTAIKLGYTHLDGAEVYNTELELGQAIKESGVSRSSLFVTTKVNFNFDNIPKALEVSLEKLQLDYVDLYLIHQPFWAKSDADLQSAWAAMEDLQRQGKAKSIGVSNYRMPEIESTLKTAKIVPAINQIEYHPYLQHENLLAASKKHGIITQAYGPLTSVAKARGGPADLVIDELAKKYGVSAGEVALRYCIDQGVVPITTSSKETRLKEYLGVLKFKLTSDEIKRISVEGNKHHFRGFWGVKFEADDRA
ncbi:MAG: hypothetical protein M1814_000304 [Vezdaea aestivalis]|nr:MAG: hypothetical protein M1814_000304 [Vezdaea aestivalis]